jgi:Tol biopolymer transport system component
MPLAPGTQLGPYEIVALIGKGGMGEVYRARDPRMGREVAIKVSADRFSERFDREVRAVAALNHPNICQIYDVGPNYLVLELVEGEAPAGPLALDEALRITKQIADALEAAHDKGIVHRDLKPANIKIKADGTVKVLDFGLAKHTQPNRDSDGAGNQDSPTLSMAATQAGMILGTAGYMSPEQAKGKSVDKRADIWAFGVVFYELIAGKRLFHGEDVTDTLAAIVREQPDLSAVPPHVRPLLQCCLEKDPKKRLRDIGDVDALLGASDTGSAPQVKPRPAWLPWTVAALFAIGAGIALWAPWRRPPEPALARFQIPLPSKTSVTGHVGISPDGRWLVFVTAGSDGRYALWLRSLQTLEPRMLAGSEGATAAFWSPDSRFLAFAAGGKLKKVDISGGPPQPICDTPPVIVGGDWSREGVILLGDPAGPILQVPASGGTPSPITAIDRSHQENRHMYPVFLPDGRHFLYLRLGVRPESSGLYAGSLDAKPSEQSLKQVLATQISAHYVASTDSSGGRLLFLRDRTLLAQPLDTGRLELTGSAVPVAENVGSFLNTGFFGSSDNGVLIYKTGVGGADNQLVWMDRQGKTLGPAVETGIYLGMKLSPDGKRAAVSRISSQGNSADIWITEFTRSASARFTFGPGFAMAPIWSPDGSRVVYITGATRGSTGLYQKVASGAGKEEALLQSGVPSQSDDWSRDGRFLLYESENPKTKSDLWVLPDPGTPAKAGDRKPFLFLGTEFNESQGQFSPDTKWISYTSDESGRPEIYVRPFPTPSGGGGQWLVSAGGGTHPRWRRDGKELLYLSPDNKLMAVEVSSSVSAFQIVGLKALFEVPPVVVGTDLPTWDISPDGQRFLISAPTSAGDNSPVTVVLNWQAGLKK